VGWPAVSRNTGRILRGVGHIRIAERRSVYLSLDIAPLRLFLWLAVTVQPPSRGTGNSIVRFYQAATSPKS